jgi:hypothetical protein
MSKETQPVDAIVGGDEQQRARSGRATAARAAQREALAVCRAGSLHYESPSPHSAATASRAPAAVVKVATD